MSIRTDSVWALVLAGGEGERLRDLTTNWLGYHRPKQYCTFVGTRSMLEHTLDRIPDEIPPEQILTVIGTGHSRFLDMRRPLRGRLIEQPANRDTGPGILLPLAYVMAEDPSATVLIFPSDHFVYPESRLQTYIRRAAWLAGSFSDRIVLLAATPDNSESDYGWIQAGEKVVSRDGASAWAVSRFYEKPSPAESRIFLNRGLWWNTMIMAIRAETLWSWCAGFFPGVVRRLEALSDHFRMTEPEEPWVREAEHAFERVFEGLECFNFSRDILQEAAHRALLLPMEGLQWSDWGRPSRIRDTLRAMSRQPAFPIEVPEGIALLA